MKDIIEELKKEPTQIREDSKEIREESKEEIEYLMKYFKKDVDTLKYDALLKEFLSAIELDDEKKIVDTFHKFKGISLDEQVYDLNFYLLLLNYIYDLKEDDLKDVSSLRRLNGVNLLLFDVLPAKYYLENKIRSLVLNNNMSAAYAIFVKFRGKESQTRIDRIITYKLLSKCKVEENKDCNKMFQYISNKKFEKLDQFLHSYTQEKRNSDFKEILKQLVSDYLEMSNSSKILNNKKIESNSFKIQIENRNYREALEILEKMKNKSNLYFKSFKEMLTIICQLIERKESQIGQKKSLSANNLEYLDEVANLISEQNMDLEDSINTLNLEAEYANMVKLFYIRDCYYLGLFSEGDKYLRKAERVKNKSGQFKMLLEEIKRNRLFYKNKFDEKGECLVLRKYN